MCRHARTDGETIGRGAGDDISTGRHLHAHLPFLERAASTYMLVRWTQKWEDQKYLKMKRKNTWNDDEGPAGGGYRPTSNNFDVDDPSSFL